MSIVTDSPQPPRPTGVKAGGALASPDAPRVISVRAVSVALAGVVGICTLAPFNDFTLGNTPMVGNFLAVSAVLVVFVLVCLVNAPLSRFRPRLALTGGELCLILGMLLVGCSVPTTGLVRYFIPSLVMPHAVAVEMPQFGEVLYRLDLPEWIFPRFASTDPSTWGSDPITTGFTSRWPDDTPFPFSAWLRPLATWGVFFAALATALISMVWIVHVQWADNERLPFPIAQIQLSLVQAPAPGRWFNQTLGQPTFWIGLGAVFLLHLWNGLSVYSERQVPGIPLSFSLTSVFTEPPFNYAEANLYRAQLYITAAVVTYFLRPQVSFSLWGFYVGYQCVRMVLGTTTGEPSLRGQADLHNGAFLGFVAMVLFTGRRYYAGVIAAASGLRRGGDRTGAVAARVLFAAVIVATVWLWLAGCTLAGAAVIVLMLMILLFGMTRIVAETGIVHAQFQLPVSRPFSLPAAAGWGRPVPDETFFHAQRLQCIAYDQHESLPVYTSHALKAADTVAAPRSSRRYLGVIACLGLALLVAYPVAAYSHLSNEYAHASTLDIRADTPIDGWGARYNWAWVLAPNVTNYANGYPATTHDPVGWMAAGAALVTVLYTARLYFPAWPVHPVGLLLVGSYSLYMLWFSFFVGWAAKCLAVRLGGYDLYTRSKPFAVGMIIGECLAAGTWMVVAILLQRLGLPYRSIMLMPY